MPIKPRLLISHKHGLIALFSATSILAFTGVLAKSISLDAITITFARCFFAFGALICVLTLQKSVHSFRLQHKSHYWKVLMIGGLMSVHWSSFFHSMQISTVAIGILAHYSYPVITVILEPLLDKKPPKIADLFAATIVVIGVAIMVPSWQMNSESALGVAFGLLSATTWAARNVLQRRWLSDESSQTVMAYQLLVIVVFTAGFCNFPSLAAASNHTWLLIAVLGVVCTALGHTLFSIALRAINAKSVSLMSCLQPAQAIFLSWLILSETPTLQTLIGGSIILGIAAYEALKINSADT